MSFSSEVKDELVRVAPSGRNQMLAELSAMLFMVGKRAEDADGPVLSFASEHSGTVRKYFTLLKKAYNIDTGLSVMKRPAGKRSHTYTVILRGTEAVEQVLAGCKLQGGLDESGFSLSEKRLIYDNGSRRSFLRGTFLAAGSVSDPEKFYHLEFVCQSLPAAEFLKDLLSSFGEEGGIVKRKHSRVLYFKGSDEIVEILGLMEAPQALMRFENIRIVKDMRNSVNRKVNCETANISKTVSAAVKQLEDIEYIRDTEGLDSLPANLREMAEVRLRYPDAPLRELGSRMDPQVGKSGVNHRLRKLSEYAEQLRGVSHSGR